MFSQNGGWDRLRKRKKKFSSEFRSHDQGRKIPKNIEKKNQKIKKPLSGIISSQNGGLDRPRKRQKIFSPKFLSYSTRARNFRKKLQKKSKN